jgi:hypothetical protein
MSEVVIRLNVASHYDQALTAIRSGAFHECTAEEKSRLQQGHIHDSVRASAPSH